MRLSPNISLSKLIIALMLCFLATTSTNLCYAQGEADDEFETFEDNKPAGTNSQTLAAANEDDEDDDSDEQAKGLSDAQNAEATEMLSASRHEVRRFHEVLDELLAEFGYDIKTGQMKSLKNLAIRKINVNSALPPSYKSYVELLIAEQIRENSQIRIVSCVTCKNRTSRMVQGKLIITSPTTNMAAMDQASKMLGIDYFMDVVLVYHTTHMVLAMQVFNADTKEMVWARTYNSETIKSRFQKLAVDYSQIEKPKPGEDYKAEFRYLVGFGGATVPNVSGNSDDESMLALTVRGTERFDNRTNEFGLGLDIFQSTNQFLSNYPTEGTSTTTTDTTTTDTTTTTLKPFTTAIGLYMIYAYNFLGAIESYNNTRYALSISAGPLLASSYISSMIKAGGEIYFGRRFGVSIAGIFINASKVQVNNEFQSVKGGSGGEIAVLVNF